MTVEQTEDSPGFTFRWEHILVAGVLSVSAAFAAFSLAALKSEPYSQLIVGRITWNQGLKRPDYILLLSLIASFLLIYVRLHFLSQRVRKVNGEAAEFALRQLLIYCLLPCGILLGKILVNSNDVVTDVVSELFGGSLFLLWILLVLAVILTLRQSGKSYQEYIESVGGSLLFVVFSLLIGSALSLAAGRVHLSWQPTHVKQVKLVSGIGAFLLWLPLLKIWLEPLSNFNRFRLNLRVLLWAVQAFFPLFFLTLLPTPWIVGKEKLYGYAFTPALPILIAVAIVIAYIDWFRRFKPPLQPQEVSVFSAISPAGLIALLLYIKAPLLGAGVIPVDDYHWGEFLLPWWLLKSFHSIPFWDYEPARGLVNYIAGLFANLFFGETAAAYQVASSPGNAVLMLPYLSILFLALSRTIGLLPAFLACLLMPMADGISEIDCMTTAALCVWGNALFDCRWSRWLLVWGVSNVALLLFAPGQGGLLIISTLPIAGFALFQAVRKERQKLIFTAAAGLSSFLLLCLLTPLGKMLIGAVRYGAEQSSINSIAHGISWAASVNSNPVLSYWLWEAIRISWIFVGMAVGLLVFRAVVDKAWAGRYRYAAFGIPILLLTILFIPRAAGRIDPGGLSRLGSSSIWAICLLLPIVLITAYGQRRKAFSLILVAFLGGLLVGVPVPNSLLNKPVQAFEVKSLKYVNADRLHLPHLEQTFVHRDQLDRLRKINRVLRAVLNPGETYLDLTNHGADYFYLGYPPPIQSGTYYNLPHQNQQLRALQRLETNPPPIVLASSNNALFDGGTASLRSHLLYRYVVEQYIPLQVDDFIYMIRPDRLQQLSDRAPRIAKMVPTDTEARLKLLDEVFRTVDLQKIPSAWGESFASLKSQLQPIKVVDATAVTQTHAVSPIIQTAYRITGEDPYISFDVTRLNLNGRDAGILAFDFSNDKNAPANLEVYWGSRSLGGASEDTVVRFSAQPGKVIVPLDTAPRWLLAEGIQTIRFDVADPDLSTFSISNVTLLQRAELAKR